MCECTYDTLCDECAQDRDESFSISLLRIGRDENTDYDNE